MNEVAQPKTGRGFAGLIDRAIMAIAPIHGAKRLAARRLGEITEAWSERMLNRIGSGPEKLSAWEGATHDRKSGSNWLTSNLTPDEDLLVDLPTLRDRSRSLSLNSEHASGAVEQYTVNIVGTGIRPQPNIVDDDVNITEEQARRWNSELAVLWERVSPSLGMKGESFNELQKVKARQIAVDGEGLSHFADQPRFDRPIPLKIEIIDAARLETPYGNIDGRKIRNGVEYNRDGSIKGYWIRGTNSYLEPNYPDHRFLPADVISHAFERIHPDQSRGVPWLAPVMNQLKNLKDVNEAELIRAQVACCFAVFIKSQNAPGDLAERMASQKDAKGKRIEDLRPGMVTYLDDGKEVQFANPNVGGSQFGEFVLTVLRSIAVALNMPIEMLTKDYSKTNYSSGRLSLIDGNQGFKVRQQTLKEKFLDPVWTIFVNQAIDFSGATTIPRELFRRMPWLFLRCRWIPPGRQWIDPEKDGRAAQLAVACGFASKSEVILERGGTLEDVAAQRARDDKLENSYKLSPMPLPAGSQPNPADPNLPQNQPEAEKPESNPDDPPSDQEGGGNDA